MAAGEIVSVATVILAHLAFESGIKDQFPTYKHLLYSPGHLGVEIFFFISGFIITKGAIEERNKTGTFGRSAFYVRRCFRILPPLWLLALGIAVLAYFNLVQTDSIKALPSLLFTCDVRDCGWIFGHTWSLAVEEQFYLLFPFRFLLSAFSRAFLIVGYVLLLSAVILLARYSRDASFLISCFSTIVLGMISAFWSVRIQKLLAPLPSTIVWVSFVALFVVSALHAEICWALSPRHFTRAIGNAFIEQPLIAIAVLASMYIPSSLNTVLGNKSVVTLGRASYGIYLWQQLAVTDYGVKSPWFYIASVAGVCVLALIQFRYIERPLMRIARSFSKALVAHPSVKTT
jgi:peptidoglycan/LPS O-acetylase OafA/YrhL